MCTTRPRPKMPFTFEYLTKLSNLFLLSLNLENAEIPKLLYERLSVTHQSTIEYLTTHKIWHEIKLFKKKEMLRFNLQDLYQSKETKQEEEKIKCRW